MTFDKNTDVMAIADCLPITKVSQVCKIINSGYKISSERCTNLTVEQLNRLSNVVDDIDDQKTFTIYAKALETCELSEEEENFILNKKMSTSDKNSLIHAMKHHYEYQYILDKAKPDTIYVKELKQIAQLHGLKNAERYADKFLEAGYTISEIKELADLKYNFSAISGLLKAKKEGIDILSYIRPYYKDRVDVNLCTTFVKIYKSDPNFDTRNYKEYFKYNFSLWERLHDLDVAGIDINLHQWLRHPTAIKLLHSMYFKQNINIQKYIDKPITKDQLRIIYEAANAGLDYTLFDDYHIPAVKMDAIRKILKQNVLDGKSVVSIVINSDDFTELTDIVKKLSGGNLDEKIEIIKKFNLDTVPVIKNDDDIER